MKLPSFPIDLLILNIIYEWLNFLWVQSSFIYMSTYHFVVLLPNIHFINQAKFFMLLLMDIWVISTLKPLWRLPLALFFVSLFDCSHMFSFFKHLGRTECLSPSLVFDDIALEERALGICVKFRTLRSPRSFLCLLVFYFMSLVNFVYFVGFKDLHSRRDTFHLIFILYFIILMSTL